MNGEEGMKLFPELQELWYLRITQDGEAFTEFINAWECRSP
jgi:hypothetical protein